MGEALGFDLVSSGAKRRRKGIGVELCVVCCVVLCCGGGWKAAMFYGAMIWDPWLILAQIVCIQSLYYVSLGVFLWAFVGTQVPAFTLKYFFDYSIVTASSVVGWSTIAALLANALCG